MQPHCHGCRCLLHLPLEDVTQPNLGVPGSVLLELISQMKQQSPLVHPCLIAERSSVPTAPLGCLGAAVGVQRLMSRCP